MKVTFEVEPKEFVEMAKEFANMSMQSTHTTTQLKDWATFGWPMFDKPKGEEK
jgi:hypothetical protein